MNRLTYIQQPVIKPSIYMVLTIVAFALAYWQLDALEVDMNNQMTTELTQVESLYQEVKRTIEKIELFRRYEARYKALTDSGIIGVQARADWVDKMMEAINHYEINGASIQFAPRMSLEQQQLSVASDGHLIHYEAIEFNGNFQHEIDFLNFMNHVKEKVNALTLLQGCVLSHVNRNATPTVNPPVHYQKKDGNIQAKCQFNFVEVAPKPISVNQHL